MNKHLTLRNARGRRHRRRHDRLCRVLARDHSGHRAGLGAAAIHAERRQRQNDVQHRRLQFLPRGAQQGPAERSIALQLGGGLELPWPFGTFVVPNISPDPADGIGKWSEGGFRHRAVGWNRARAAITFTRRFPTAPIGTCELTDVRDLFAYLKTLPPVTGRPAGTIWHFRSTSGGCSAAGSSSTSPAVRSCPIQRNPRNGTAGPIW